MSELDVVRGWVDAGLASLEASRQRIDDLNVYPVPDGDTGTNLTLTLRALKDSLAHSSATERAQVAHDVTRGALMGARGNSGVIFSQIVRGAAESLGAAAAVDAIVIATATRSASDAAYRAVRRPVEGTMLSVIRALAEEAEAHADANPRPPELLAALVERGARAVELTQQQLDVLRDAGVVDAGAAGLLEILRGVVAAVSGEPLPEAPPEPAALAIDAIHQELSRYRYCTVFLVEGENLDRETLETQLDRLGDSLLVVGDSSALKVHLHTDDPGAALSLATKVGTIDRVEIANMHEQTVAREERLLHAVPDVATAVVAVAAGGGNRRLFESLGASRVVEGGQSMNPSTAELVAAVDAVAANDVVLLPNNSNVILSAEQAASMSPKRVEVVASDSIPAGLAAMVAYDGAASLEENSGAMRDAIDGVATGEVTIASRDAELNGFSVQKGRWLGLAEGKPVAQGQDFDDVAEAVVERLLAQPRGVVTLLRGADEPDVGALVARISERHPEVELDVQTGGQPHYPLLISAE